MLKGAELNVRNAKNNVEDQDDELDQLKKMYKTEELTNATADIVVKRAVRNLELAKIREGMSEQSAEKVKQFNYQTDRQKLVFNIEKEKQEMAQLRATQDQQKALRQTTLTGAKLATDKAKLKLEELREDAAAFSTKAPFDGVVLYGQLQRGAWQNADPKLLRADDKISPAQVILTFVAPGKMRLMTDVPESKLGMVKPGLTAHVVPTGHAERLSPGRAAIRAPSA
jgi:multidrug resistance efflux pump